MFRITIALMICLFATLASAQGVFVGIEAQPAWVRSSVNVHDGQLDLVNKHFQFDVSALAVAPGRWRARYTLVPGFRCEETVFDPQHLMIGNAEYSVTDRGTTDSKKEPKAVSVEWKIPIGHRFEVAPDWRVRPILVGEIIGFNIEATGKDKDDKIVTDNESYKRFCVGVGGAWSYITPDVRVDCKGALGDRYVWAQAHVQRLAWRDMSIGVGYQFKQVRFPNDITAKSDGVFGFLAWSW